MIYYLKQQVSLGDKVNINGVKVELSQQIVDDNPQLFEVVCEDDILIKEARNRYKVGDVIDGLASNKIRSRINNLYQIRISNHKVLVDGAHDNGCALVLFENNKWAEVVEPLLTSEDGVNLYEGDSYWWVDIEFDKYELSSKCTCKKEIFTDDYPESSVVFPTKEAAQKYIDENKPKDFEILSFTNNANSVIFNKVKGFDGFSSLNTGYFDKEHSEEFLLKQDHFSIHSVKRLSDGEVFTIGDLCCPNSLPSNKAKITRFEFCGAGYFRISSAGKYYLGIKSLVKCEEKTLTDYENELIDCSGSKMINGSFIFNRDFYRHLKEREPRLYYAKILQLIADDSNRDWEALFDAPFNQKYYIFNKSGGKKCVTYAFGENRGNVYFKSEELAQKAIDIMGDKLDYILN
jgi:hypothetical protein